MGSTREKNRVRARASFLIYFICYCLSRYLLAIFGIPPSKRKEKSGTHQSGCARSPQRFFCFSTPRRGYVRYNCNYNYNYSIVVLCCKGIGECLKRTLGFAGLLKSGARARVLFFILYFSFEDTLADTLIQKKRKKSPPPDRVRALTPTRQSPHAPLTHLPTGTPLSGRSRMSPSPYVSAHV